MSDKKHQDVPTATNPTERDVEQAKPNPPVNAKEISKTEVELKDNKWLATIEFKLEDGSTTKETQEFDDFSRASSWVAGMEVEYPSE